MNTKLIYSTMSQASLYLDEVTVEEIKKFIETFVGQSWINNPKLCIYVCTSIVCECKRLPAIQLQVSVPFGLTVERIMKLVSESSKQQFIQSIINIAQKWPTCPSLFLHKLENLKFNLRIYQKYNSCCKQIGEKYQLNQASNSSLSSLFWLIYLIAKSNKGQSDSLEVITLIVPFLIIQIYSFYLRLNNKHVIQEVVYEKFSNRIMKNQAELAAQQKYRREFLRILCQIYSKRYLVQLANFDFLINRPSILQRLIDDLNNKYAKIQQSSAQFSIDEMSFLNLRKDKTPEGFQQKVSKDGALIDQRISFQKQKPVEKQLENLYIKENELIKNNFLEETPLTMRMQNMSWIRNCVQNLDEKQFERVQQFYQKFSTGKFQEFYNKIQRLLETVINQFSPTCKDINKRKKEIYKFFVYVISIAIDMYNEEIRKIFEGDHLIISIFCLCTEIFNFVYQTYSGYYSRYCQIFQVDYINAFWPINWFGYFIKLPKAVQDHLYNMQRRFLLKQIWVTDLGFKIITNNEEIIRINQLRMLQRLKHHIKCRIDQICRQTIGEKMIKKINNMVLQLIEQKPHLLKKNNIDQIIICSIAACLSINQDGNRLSLEKIFNYYQKVSLSSIQNKQKLYDKNQNELNIVDFYNLVFLQEIGQIMTSSPQNSHFLLTPRRLQLAQKYKQGIQMTPLSLKYKDDQSAFVKKIGEFSHGNSYQLNLARNIKIESQQQMMQEEEDSSMQDENK